MMSTGRKTHYLIMMIFFSFIFSNDNLGTVNVLLYRGPPNNRLFQSNPF